MGILQFKEANCKNCYNCVRHCPVKSIAVSDEQAKILEDGCVLCGQCFGICTQNAKHVQSDLNKVRDFIRKGNKVYISMAPSHAVAFPKIGFGKLSAALKQLGFTGVEETAIGAAKVSEAYSRFVAEERMENIITTSCPTVVMLVEKYFPHLAKYLAPVVSPMVAHGKMMRQIYGDRIKVVFVGPCISKKAEAAASGEINAVLSFEEIQALLDEKGLQPEAITEAGFEMQNTINRMYPVPGGILKTMSWDTKTKYQRIAIDGLDRCINILTELSQTASKNYFIEMSACTGVCLGGPLHGKKTMQYLTGQNLIKENVRRSSQLPSPISEDIQAELATQFHPTGISNNDIPDEETIHLILASTGKAEEASRLNCGTCGYPTCREKAIAVFQGKADVNMCLPFMREKAESFANFILDNTPNGIFLLDADFNILEYNLAALKMFGLTDLNYKGEPIDMILDSDVLVQAKNSGNNTFERRVYYKQLQLTVQQKVIYIAPHNNYMLIIDDLTEEIRSEAQIKARQEETLATAQKIIDKQMRTAQEIASLLGETTGESKAVLTNLKKSIMADMQGEIKEE